MRRDWREGPIGLLVGFLIFLSLFVPIPHGRTNTELWLGIVVTVAVGIWLFWPILRQRREGPIGTIVACLLLAVAVVTPHGWILEAPAVVWLFWPVLWHVWKQLTDHNEEVSL